MKLAWTMTWKGEQLTVAAELNHRVRGFTSVRNIPRLVCSRGKPRHSEQDVPGLLGLVSSDLFLGQSSLVTPMLALHTHTLVNAAWNYLSILLNSVLMVHSMFQNIKGVWHLD